MCVCFRYEMRSLLFLVAVCCLVLSAVGSPISRSEDDEKQVAVARQSAAAAPAAASDDDDDDEEDDDDDDVDLGGGLGNYSKVCLFFCLWWLTRLRYLKLSELI